MGHLHECPWAHVILYVGSLGPLCGGAVGPNSFHVNRRLFLVMCNMLQILPHFAATTTSEMSSLYSTMSAACCVHMRLHAGALQRRGNYGHSSHNRVTTMSLL